METLINQFFWLWVPLSVFPEWFRSGFIIFVFVLLLRPVLLYWLPTLLTWLFQFLKKVLLWVSYPIISIICSVQSKRRDSGRVGSPFWIRVIESLFSFLEQSLDKSIMLTKKRFKNPLRVKKWVRSLGIIFATLFSLAIINNPNESYAVKWRTLEKWINEEKLQKSLRFNQTEFTSNFQLQIQKTLAAINPKELTLRDEHKDGGNIRQEPSTDGEPIGGIVGNEIVTYLNEEQIDNEGIKWLKVKTKDGIVGWISERIVKDARNP